MKVLLADDDEGMRFVLGDVLRREGFDVVLAQDGEQAWSLIARGGARLVVCDWNMPALSGLELCRRVRAVPGTAYVYFILITGLDLSREKAHEAMRAGVDDILVKPLDLVLVSLRLRAAQRVLSYANRLQELESVIPICSYCRRLRDEKDVYERMESYFLKHAGVMFSHGACPECAERLYPKEGAASAQ